MAKYTDAKIQVAKSLYLRRYTPAEIAEELSLPNRRIVYYWAEKWNWADMLSHESVIEAINRRIVLLSERTKKTELELDELDRLIASHVKLMAQANKHAEKMAALKSQSADMQGGADYAINEDGEPKKKKRYRKNDISSLT
ncbi:terminase, partial [Providencia rettgeri]